MRRLIKVRGKARLLFRMDEATVDQPDGVIKGIVYPVVSQKMLQNLVDEFKTLGVNTEQQVHESMRSSYGSHYRRMLMPVLERLNAGVSISAIAREFSTTRQTIFA